MLVSFKTEYQMTEVEDQSILMATDKSIFKFECKEIHLTNICSYLVTVLRFSMGTASLHSLHTCPDANQSQ